MLETITGGGSKPVEGDFERLFPRVKQMNGIDDDKYWAKRPLWKRPNYDRETKSYTALQNLKNTLHVASHGEWQSDCEIIIARLVEKSFPGA